MGVFALKTKIRGPAPAVDGGAEDDQIDEAIRLFRANVLFRNFEVLGPADRTLIYLTLFIHQVRSALARGSLVCRWVGGYSHHSRDQPFTLAPFPRRS